MQIFVDADACPVKDEVAKVAARHDLVVTYVSNSHMRLPMGEKIQREVVGGAADEADHWIVEHAEKNDIVITADVPLAVTAHKKGAHVINHNGKAFTEDSIGMALAMRNLMSQLRETGDVKGSNPVFTPADRSRFLQSLENTIQAIKRVAAI